MKKMRDQSMMFFLIIITIVYSLLLQKLDAHLNEVHVGLIVNMESWEGKIAKTSIEMALSDFYKHHHHSKTRLVLHTRDSKGHPMTALSAALDLLNGFKVEAIIDPQSQLETKFMEEILREKARNIPIVSFLHTSIKPSKIHPIFVQIIENQNSQVKSIISMIEAFKRKEVVLIYDNFNYQSEGIFLLNLEGFLRKKNINISYKKLNSTSDEDFFEELKKMKSLQRKKVFIVHLSPLFLTPFFSNVAKLGMMSKGFSWIMTTKSTNGLDSLNSSLIDSMEGVIGFKNYKPNSLKLNNFTSRMRMELPMEDPYEKNTDRLIGSFGISAYDGISCLVKAIERIGSFGSGFGPIFLKELLKIELSGINGGGVKFHMIGKWMSNNNNAMFQIVNTRRDDFWSTKTKMERREMRDESSSNDDLEAIRLQENKSSIKKKRFKKLRVGVPIQGFKELVHVEFDDINKTKVTGYCIDVFEAAINLLPHYEISYEYIPFINSSKGMRGTYEEMVSQVYFKEVDAVVGDVTITPNRSQYFDFTISITDMGVGMVGLDDSKNTWLFFKPLSKNLWITILCFFILTGFVVWLIERPINHEFQGSSSQQIGTTLWFAFSTLVYAHREKLVNNLSKFVVIIWLFLVFILNSSYTATLASMMTVKQLQLDPKHSYIGLPTANSTLNVIVSHLEFQDFTMKTYLSSPMDYANALINGSKNGGVSAIVDEIPYIKTFLARYASQNFYLLGTRPTTNGFGFVFPKGSPLVSEMSRAIEMLRENETLKMFEDKWFTPKDKPSNFMGDDSSMDFDSPNALTIDNFRGLFIISGTSSALALLIFMFVQLCKNIHVIKEVMVSCWMKIIKPTEFPTKLVKLEYCKRVSYRDNSTDKNQLV